MTCDGGGVVEFVPYGTTTHERDCGECGGDGYTYPGSIIGGTVVEFPMLPTSISTPRQPAAGVSPDLARIRAHAERFASVTLPDEVIADVARILTRSGFGSGSAITAPEGGGLA